MTDDASAFLGDSLMAEAIRRHDWTRTPLGPIAGWPATLKSAVALALGSHLPQAVIWGPELTTIHNDAFVPILGDKPTALGRPLSAIWRETWAELGPLVADAFAGKATFIEDFPLLVERGGTPEAVYFTFCYSPIRDERGRIAGMLDTVIETTAAVRYRRRLTFLDELGRAVAAAVDADEVMATTTRMVAAHLHLSNCAYADMDPDQDGFTIRGDWAAPGSPRIAGHYSLAAFGTLAVQELHAGRPLIVNDNLAELEPHEAATFQAIGIAATICMPLVKEGRLTALMAIHDRVPRIWTDYDLALIRDVTERSWAHIERVRADAQVREAASALAEINATLEQRVEERTARLMQAEAQLRQAQKMEAVGQLTGGIAHDFNNLLAGISGSLEIIGRRLAQGRGDGLAKFIDGAQRSAQRAAALTQRLLAFSRLQTLDPKPVDVMRLVLGMEELIRRTVGPAIDVTVAGAADLWPARIDAAQLESALLNLAINARDAMPEGGTLAIAADNVRLETTDAATRGLIAGEYLSIRVADTGSGIAPEVLERIFDPFFTTKPLGKGTGLGLSMIHGFVRQSGGAIHVESAIGRGTTMSLYLPRHEGEPPGEAAMDAAAARRPGAGGTVLVIDDEPTVRMLVVEVLQEAGYRALEAEDGPAGLALLRTEPRIDLLITDIGLPGGLTGRQVAQTARELRPELKVLFVTGFDEEAGGSGETGAEVVTKPFVVAELAGRVEEMMGR